MMPRKNLTRPEDVNLIDLLDRLLDKGIIMDPWARVLLTGTDLHKMNHRVVVDSVSTFA
jgi:hypothetical protein